MHPSYYQNFRRTTRQVWTLLLWLTSLMVAARLTALVTLVEPHQLEGRGGELLRGLGMGLRFDLKVVAIGLAPVLLLGLLAGRSPRGSAAVRGGTPYYAGLLAFVITAVAISNYFYFKTYGNHFDVFVFGLADDQTSAVLASIWSDYPVLRTFATSVAVSWAVLWFARRSVVKQEAVVYGPMRPMLVPLVVLISLAPFAAAARGTVGVFPLRRLHAQVSGYDLINKLTPNGFVALSWARSDMLEGSEFTPVAREDLVAMSERFGQADVWQELPVNKALAERPPHVVLALMEAMGTNVLIEDALPENDLLGAARQHFERDFLFERFVSGTNSTIGTIAMMLFHSNRPTISHTLAQDAEIQGSAVRPYKEAGYHTVFITGGNGMWRNLANYLPVQGFDEVLDENTIKLEFPEATGDADTWGMPDEYAFRLANRVLDEATEPTFIMIMTVSNHTPHATPAGYERLPVSASEHLCRSYSNEERCQAMLTTYQYAANALGEFISSIKGSDLGERTVIAATGDHRVRGLVTDGPDAGAIRNGVPFYLYVPPDVLASNPHRFDPQRVASHKDIFPTLYAFSLSGARYVSLAGRNLLAEEDVEACCFGFHNSVMITPEGLVRSSQPEFLYPWISDDSLRVAVEPIANADPSRHSHYMQWQSLYTNQQVAGELTP